MWSHYASLLIALIVIVVMLALIANLREKIITTNGMLFAVIVTGAVAYLAASIIYNLVVIEPDTTEPDSMLLP